MDPVLFSIGSFSLRWYGVMAALGFMVGLAIFQLNKKYAKLTSDQITNIVMLGMISGVVGARVFYVVQNWSYYSANPAAIIRVDQGGLVFYGGFILALFLVIWYVKKICKADVVRSLDALAPALAAAHALGRIGCFFNGCCYGKPAELWWSVVYPEKTEPFVRYGAMPLHPVQIYEAILNIILASVLFVLVRKCKRGITMSVYLLAYGLLRFVDEFFRGDHSDFVQGLTPAQVIGFGMIHAGIILLIIFLRKQSDETFENTVQQ
ncbi:MAG: prolipoprotein diacylglyceryl transferase [Lentisphaeria bacterium]|nr:prolipoprotein diacylglyceryl transferase [Lentisphaeria bacterium]